MAVGAILSRSADQPDVAVGPNVAGISTCYSAHHMTSTFLNRKARQNSARAHEHQKSVEASAHLAASPSGHTLPPMSITTYPRPSCNLQLKKTGGNAQIPPEFHQVCNFPYWDSHTISMHTASKRSQSPISPPFDFGISTTVSINTDTPSYMSKVPNDIQPSTWQCHTHVTTFHTWKVCRISTCSTRLKASRPRKH